MKVPEFFVDPPPPGGRPKKIVKPVEKAPETPQVEIASQVPDLDDPSVLLRQLGGDELARDAEIATKNAHLDAVRMMELARRKARQEAEKERARRKGR